MTHDAIVINFTENSNMMINTSDIRISLSHFKLCTIFLYTVTHTERGVLHYL